MPGRISTKTKRERPTDPNQIAYFLVQRSTEETASDPKPMMKTIVPKSISRVMAKMGSKGGKIGGKRRLVTMTPELRSQIASDAAKARWKKAGS